MSNSTILLNFPSYLTKKIAENGFLNQHQTSTGLGNANQEQPRDLLEQGLYKTRFPNLLNEDQSLVKKINQIRPKSSFIQFNDVKNNLSQSRSYGDILAGFTSRDIKERTVFTEIDSLGLLSAVEKDINSIKVTPLIAKGLDKPVDINMGYREALIAGEITMDQVDYFLVGCKLPYYRKTSDDYSSESYYNDVNHKKDFVDTLYYLLDKNYKVFGCNINTKNEGYEKGEEITKNNLFDSAYLSAYLKIIEKKVNKIIKPQIKGLNTEITITTESLKKDKAEINNDKINAEEKSYYKNKIEKHKKLLKENIEKLNELHKLDEKNKKDLKTLIID